MEIAARPRAFRDPGEARTRKYSETGRPFAEASGLLYRLQLLASGARKAAES